MLRLGRTGPQSHDDESDDVDWHSHEGLGTELHGTELTVILPIVQLADFMSHSQGESAELRIENEHRCLLSCSLFITCH